MEELDGLAAESVDESECGIAFFVLDSVFVPCVLDPVLVHVGRVAGHEADNRSAGATSEGT